MDAFKKLALQFILAASFFLCHTLFFTAGSFATGLPPIIDGYYRIFELDPDASTGIDLSDIARFVSDPDSHLRIGYTFLLLRGTDSIQETNLNARQLKLFANNLSQSNSPLFKLKDRYKNILNVSFFAPQGFLLEFPSDKVGIEKLFNRSGNWEIHPSDNMCDFDINAFKDITNIEDFISQSEIAKLYRNTETRPQHDSIIILRDANKPKAALNLTDVIDYLHGFEMYYISLDIASNRINHYGQKNPSYMENRMFSETLDFKWHLIYYNIEHGFIGYPDDSALQREGAKINVVQWLDNIRSGLQSPDDFSYLSKKILYASMAKMREQKQLFINKSIIESTERLERLEPSESYKPELDLLDNELTEKLKHIFDRFIEEIPQMPEDSYNKFSEAIRKINPSANIEKRIRIIFAHETSKAIARRIALTSPKNTHLFYYKNNNSKKLQRFYLSKPNTDNPYNLVTEDIFKIIKPLIFNEDISKRFIFLGSYSSNRSENADRYNYQKEKIAADILNTMLENYEVYPNEIEFINYFDTKKSDYEPKYFEHALTNLSLDEKHKNKWDKASSKFRSSNIMEIMKINDAQIITPSGTLLNLEGPDLEGPALEGPDLEGTTAKIQQPTIIWNWLELTPDVSAVRSAQEKEFEETKKDLLISLKNNSDDSSFILKNLVKISLNNTFERPFISKHFIMPIESYSLKKSLMEQKKRYKLSLERAGVNTNHAFKENYKMHLISAAYDIKMSIPLSDQGAEVHKHFWKRFLSSSNEWLQQNIELPDREGLINKENKYLKKADVITLKPYNLLPFGTYISVVQNTLLPGDDDEDLTEEDFEELDLLTNTDQETERLGRSFGGLNLLNPANCLVNPSISGNASTSRERYKRSIPELCSTDTTEDFIKESHEALRLISDYHKLHEKLTHMHSIQISAVGHKKVPFEPIIDQEDQVRLLSYERGKINISKPISNITEADKDIIGNFNALLADSHQAMGKGIPFSANQFWLAYIAVDYAKRGISTDIRSLLNAAVFFPSILLESMKLPVSLIHQLKTSDVLAKTLGFNAKKLNAAIVRFENKAQRFTPAIRSFGKGFNRFGSGVMFYNFVDDLWNKPDFQTASTEQKSLWGLQTATDGVFAAESLTGLIEEFTLYALPGAELLGPLGLGLFAVTEAVELAYQAQHWHQRVAAENHWIKVARDHYLQGPCQKTLQGEKSILDCSRTSLPIHGFTLDTEKVSWEYGHLLLNKTIFNQEMTFPSVDSEWKNAIQLMPIFKEMDNSVQSLDNKIRIVVMPGMPHRQIDYRYENQPATLEISKAVFGSIIGVKDKNIATEACSGRGRLWVDTSLRAQYQALKSNHDPESLAYCLQVLTNHKFCPTVFPLWDGKQSCRTSYNTNNLANINLTQIATNYRDLYKYTRVTVDLKDESSYVLVTPKIMSTSTTDLSRPTKLDRYHNIKYFIEGNGQHNVLIVQPGFNYRIIPKSQEEAWLLVVPDSTEISSRSQIQSKSAHCGHGQIEFKDAHLKAHFGTTNPFGTLCIEGRIKPQLHFSYAHSTL